MKNLFFALLMGALSLCYALQAQTLNWANLTAEKHSLASAQMGFEYGLVYGAAYGYRLGTKLPLLLTAEASLPAGNRIFDDYKTKVGAQVRFTSWKDFHAGARAQAIVRGYGSGFARLTNIGSDVAVNAGYYRKLWFFAAEAGLDNALATHIHHTERYLQTHPAAVGGWYANTGGNVYYGIQTGVSFWKNDLTLKFGKMHAQAAGFSPTLPMYAMLGYTYKW